MTEAPPATLPPHYQTEEGAAAPSAGFQARFFAMLIDLILSAAVISTIGWLLYGSESWESKPIPATADLLLNQLVPGIATILLWVAYGTTPGKFLMGLHIVDEKTLGPISLRQAAIRYIGYFASTVVCLLGFLWALWEPKRRCWHDLFAGTVVVERNGLPERTRDGTPS